MKILFRTSAAGLSMLLLSGIALMWLGGCASGNPPREDQMPAAAADEELQPLGGNQKVCGWSDTGRWVCEEKGKKKKKGSKFSTTFKKKAPPPEQESKLPRGDTPTVLEPIDETGDGATSSKDDPGGG